MSEAIRARIGAERERTRGRTTVLTDAVDADDLVKQHSPLMSPLVWDLAHVGNQEELWLVRDVGGLEPVRCDIDHLYDAFKHPRRDRPALPLLDPAQARAYNRTVRDKVLDLLDRTPLEGRPLVDNGFAFGMIAQHEQQHDETMLATHQLRAGGSAGSSRSRPTSRWCTCASTRRRRTRPGLASACPPRRSGRRRRGSTRRPAGPAGTRGATRTRSRTTPIWASGT